MHSKYIYLFLTSLFLGLSCAAGAKELHSSLHTYEIGNILGSGRRGEVHAAVNEKGDLYALKKMRTKKEMREQGTSSNEIKRLFNADGFAIHGVLAYLNGKIFKHPNISKSYELILKNKRSWVVMEYIEGKTVAAVEHRSLNTEDAFAMGMQFLDVLEYITLQGYYHSDLFGQNFMVSDQLQLKMIDLDGIKRLNGKDSLNRNKRIEDYFRMVHVILWEILNTGAFTNQELEELRNQFKALMLHHKFKHKLQERVSVSFRPLIFDYFDGLRKILNGQDVFAEWPPLHHSSKHASKLSYTRSYWR